MRVIKYCFSLFIFAFCLIITFTYVQADQNSKKKVVVNKKSIKKTQSKKISNPKRIYSKNPNCTSSYKIKKGDTIRKIAKLKGISEQEIIAINKNINPRMLKPGQIILIPSVTLTRTNREDKSYSALKSPRKYSLANEEMKKLENVKNNNTLTNTFEDEDFDSDEEIINENIAESETKKDEYLFSLRDDDLKKLINSALDYIGATYKYGGDSIASLDCSAFVRRVFKEVNINLPRTSREQYTLGAEVSLDELREGDLIFFAKKNRINHVGIYIGNNMYIHAARKGKGVIVSSLESPYVKRYFVGAKRLFNIQSASTENVLKEELIN